MLVAKKPGHHDLLFSGVGDERDGACTGLEVCSLLPIQEGNSQITACRERHMGVFTTEIISDLGSCLEIWAAANVRWPLFRRHAFVDALISFHIFTDTYIPVFSSQRVVFTLFFLPDISLHTTQDNGVRLCLDTRIKNALFQTHLNLDAFFYHLIVPVHAISSHRAFCYHL